MMSLTCPKCHGEMRQYERSGVVIDQCSECRGIFLDRGELEKLFEAEANWNRQQTAAAPAGAGGHAQPAHQPAGYPPPPPAPHQPGYGAVPPPPPPAHGYPPAPAYGHGQQHHGYHGHYRKKKHKSFLDDFFG
ncbi:zf-TFIIB domain-containing protein [Micromonospora sp. NPDC023737]|uniref:TFIIB-type zinc ribbon-containing protein n=1 Tax=unclassified Micromonospora TaxID=2617518 RepID=UPI0033EE5D0A